MKNSWIACIAVAVTVVPNVLLDNSGKYLTSGSHFWLNSEVFVFVTCYEICLILAKAVVREDSRIYSTGVAN